jgi:hypothetical protein
VHEAAIAQGDERVGAELAGREEQQDHVTGTTRARGSG